MIGIVPGVSVEEANPHCTHVVASAIGYARTFGKPVVALRSWGLTGRERTEGAPGVTPVETAEEAVAAALNAV